MHTHTDRYKYIKRLSFNLAKPLHEYEKKIRYCMTSPKDSKFILTH